MKNNEDILKLFEITNVRSSIIQGWEVMISQMMAAEPDAPAEVWDIFRSNFDIDEAFNQLIPIYRKYYTQEDIVELIKFYESTAGKKSLQNFPLIVQDTASVYEQQLQKIVQQMSEQKNHENRMSKQKK